MDHGDGRFIKFSRARLQHAYKHAADFGILVHFVDRSTRLVVIRNMKDEFLSGWILSELQLKYVLSTRKLGGGR